MNRRPLIIEHIYHAPVESIWKALTNSDDMKQWYFNIPEFKAEVGYEFRFVAGPDEARQYAHHCIITEVTENKKLAYNWNYEGYTGNSTVTFELYPEGQYTKLILAHAGLETFPENQPDFARESFAEGWKWIIGTSLKEFVEKPVL